VGVLVKWCGNHFSLGNHERPRTKVQDFCFLSRKDRPVNTQQLKPQALKAALLAAERCAQAGLTLSSRQAAIVQGAFLNTLESAQEHSPRHIAITKCATATEAICVLPPNEWAGMVCWILEALDDMLDEPETVDMLNRIKDDIDIRLTEERW